MEIPSILEKFNVNPWKNASCLCFQLTQNVRFKWNICNFKFNFLSRGQLESLNLDRIFLPLLKTLPCYEGFLVTYFLPLLLEYCAEIILIFHTGLFFILFLLFCHVCYSIFIHYALNKIGRCINCLSNSDVLPATVTIFVFFSICIQILMDSNILTFKTLSLNIIYGVSVRLKSESPFSSGQPSKMQTLLSALNLHVQHWRDWKSTDLIEKDKLELQEYYVLSM